MLFLSKITILHIFYRFEDHMTKKKIFTRDVTNFNPIKSEKKILAEITKFRIKILMRIRFI